MDHKYMVVEEQTGYKTQVFPWSPGISLENPIWTIYRETKIYGSSKDPDRITALLVDGYHLFLGLDSGEIKRIHMRTMESQSCSTENQKKMQEFKREQKAEKILEKIAKKQKMTLDKTYEKIGYKLQDKFGEMFEAFDLASKSPDFLIKKGIEKKWADIIHKVAKENIQRKKVKIKAELNVRFFKRFKFFWQII